MPLRVGVIGAEDNFAGSLNGAPPLPLSDQAPRVVSFASNHWIQSRIARRSQAARPIVACNGICPGILG